jgi:putative membrane protein
MAFVRLFAWLFWTAVFVVLLLFAIKNAGPVTLHFYFDQTWHAPLVFVVAASFAAGVVLGVIACVPPLLRQRREVLGLRKELRLLRPAEAAAPPSRPAIVAEPNER